MKRRFLAILAILVGSVSIVTYAQSRQEIYDCADIPEVIIVEPKKIASEECCIPFVEPVPYETLFVEMSDVQSSSFSEEDENLLARIAMAEAEGEDVDGKALVILTVLNRVNSNEFPNTIYDVIYEPKQFSPIDNGRFDAVEPDGECYEALEMVKDGWDESKGSLYFESCKEADNWHSRNLEYLFTHDGHRFYK